MSTTENREVSVIVLTKNSIRTIRKCMLSIIDQKPGEIIAVDAFSTDGTLKVLEEFRVKVLVDHVGSIGYSRQIGVRAATGAFVAFIDSDVELASDCIARLRAGLEEFGWAGAHAMILSRENASYWQRATDESFSISFNKVGPRPHIGTITAVFRKDLLLKYPFDPNLKESCEDVDVCLRLGRRNYQVGVVDAIAYHLHRRGFSEFARQRYHYGLGDARFALKYKSIRIMFASIRSAFYQTIQSLVTSRTRLVPYRLTSGVVEFLGTMIGLSTAHHSLLLEFADQPETTESITPSTVKLTRHIWLSRLNRFCSLIPNHLRYRK